MLYSLEYTVSMFDGRTGKKNWNVSFHEYSASKMDESSYGMYTSIFHT